MPGVTRVVAAAVVRRDLRIPDVVMCEVRRLLLDTVGCMVGGWATQKGRIAAEFASTCGAGPATVAGTSSRGNAGHAAFANAELANALDADAVFLNVAHPVPAVLAGVLAVAEQVNANGRSVLEAVLFGYEVAARLTMAMTPLLEAHDGAKTRYAIGPLFGYGYAAVGVAAGVGRLLELDEDRMAHALGLAAYYCPVPSLLKWLRTRPFSMVKYSPMGWTAQAGVTAAMLARYGYTSDTTVLDDSDALPAFFGTPRFEARYLLEGLGDCWECIRWLSYKPEPICNLYRPHLWLLSRIQQAEKLFAGDIDEIVLRLYGPAGIDRPYTSDPPDTQEAVHMSGEFAIALALKGIAPGPKWVSALATEDPEVRRLMGKVRIEGNPSASQVTYRPWTGDSISDVLKLAPCAIEVKARGQTYSLYTEVTRGDLWAPADVRFTDQDLVAKFEAMTSPFLGGQRREAVVRLVLRDWDQSDTPAPLLDMLRITETPESSLQVRARP